MVVLVSLTCSLFFGLRRRRGNVEPGVGKMVSYLNRERRLDSMVGCRPVAPAAPKGIYLYGNVGSGKSSKHLTFFDMKQKFRHDGIFLSFILAKLYNSWLKYISILSSSFHSASLVSCCYLRAPYDS